MQVEWFQSFVETIRTKSLSKAGEKLNISQTALSKQIKNLEDSFGATLFNRSTAGMELTREGQWLYGKVQVWLRDIEEAKRQLSNMASIKHVVFGALPSLASHYLPEKVLRLKADGVQANIRVFTTSDDIFDAFIAGDVDVAFVDRVLNIPKVYPSADLFSEPYYAVFPQSHHLAKLATVNVADIAHEHFILYPAKCDVRKSLQRVLSETGAELIIAEEVPFGEAILGFVAAGAGVTIAPEMVAKHMGNPNLIAVPILDFNVMRTVAWVTKSTEQFHFLTPYLRKQRTG